MDIKIKRTGREYSMASCEFQITYPDGTEENLWSPPWNEWSTIEADDKVMDEASKRWLVKKPYQECPECHMKTLEVTAHCATCINCGYSLCGI